MNHLRALHFAAHQFAPVHLAGQRVARFEAHYDWRAQYTRLWRAVEKKLEVVQPEPVTEDLVEAVLIRLLRESPPLPEPVLVRKVTRARVRDLWERILEEEEEALLLLL